MSADETTVREVVGLIAALLGADERVKDVRQGPRSNEFYFQMADGRFRCVAIAVRENI
ncbi:MAG: hypothetical protein V4618_00730 [Pseudomonadota bacterium]